MSFYIYWGVVGILMLTVVIISAIYYKPKKKMLFGSIISGLIFAGGIFLMAKVVGESTEIAKTVNEYQYVSCTLVNGKINVSFINDGELDSVSVSSGNFIMVETDNEESYVTITKYSTKVVKVTAMLNEEDIQIITGEIKTK